MDQKGALQDNYLFLCNDEKIYSSSLQVTGPISRDYRYEQSLLLILYGYNPLYEMQIIILLCYFISHPTRPQSYQIRKFFIFQLFFWQ